MQKVEVAPDNKMISIYEYRNIDTVEAENVPQFLDNPSNYTVH